MIIALFRNGILLISAFCFLHFTFTTNFWSWSPFHGLCWYKLWKSRSALLSTAVRHYFMSMTKPHLYKFICPFSVLFPSILFDFYDWYPSNLPLYSKISQTKFKCGTSINFVLLFFKFLMIKYNEFSVFFIMKLAC